MYFEIYLFYFFYYYYFFYFIIFYYYYYFFIFFLFILFYFFIIIRATDTVIDSLRVNLIYFVNFVFSCSINPQHKLTYLIGVRNEVEQIAIIFTRCENRIFVNFTN